MPQYWLSHARIMLAQLSDYRKLFMPLHAAARWAMLSHAAPAARRAQDVEAVPQWVCAGCQGKRMRAPSQAAVQAAIEASREREEAEAAGAARRPSKRPRLSGAAASSAGAGSGKAQRGGAAAVAGAAQGNAPWVEAALGVLAKASAALRCAALCMYGAACCAARCHATHCSNSSMENECTILCAGRLFSGCATSSCLLRLLPAGTVSTGACSMTDAPCLPSDSVDDCCALCTQVEKLPSAEDFLKPVPRDVPGYHAVIKRVSC